MIKLCAFDLDGTVADTLTSICYFANKSLAKYGFRSIEKEKYRYFVGEGADVLVRRMIDEVGGSNTDFINVKNEYINTYNSNTTYLTEAYKGVEEMLYTLKSLGIICVIISNKPQIQAENVINKIFEKGLIEEVSGGKEGMPLKPDPTAFNEMLRKYNVSKNEALFIGDTKTDMLTAKNSGVKSIGVLWGFRDKEELKFHNASYIVSDPKEIVDIVERLMIK